MLQSTFDSAPAPLPLLPGDRLYHIEECESAIHFSMFILYLGAILACPHIAAIDVDVLLASFQASFCTFLNHRISNFPIDVIHSLPYHPRI